MDGYARRRLTRMTNDELEKSRLSFSRCANRDAAHLMRVFKTNFSLQCRRILDARVYIFVLGQTILDLVTVEAWDEEIFPEGVGVKFPRPHLASAPILYRSSIQDGGIENLICYLAFRSKITPALQAKQILKNPPSFTITVMSFEMFCLL